MFERMDWSKPNTWHLTLSSEKSTILARGISIGFFAGLTALCAQIAFTVPWTPVPYTFQTFAVLASALVAEGLDRSRNAGLADFNAQLICWFTAMIPVYIFGTLWLASAYSVDFAQAFEWGVEPFLIWDAAKIVVMAIITTNVWTYSQPEQ